MYERTVAPLEARPAPVQRGRIRLPEPFPLGSGEVLPSPEIQYSLTGPGSGPLVVALGGISATREVAATGRSEPTGWWGEMVGPGRPVDTDQYRILGMDWLGKHCTRFLPHDHGATDRATESWTSRRFPLISTQDQARALHRLLAYLGTESVHTFVGSSYGGMVGLAFAAEYPRYLRRLVVISGAHRTHPMATAHRMVQRRIVEMGRAAGSVGEGLALARALAMTTYRSMDEFEGRFTTEPRGHGGDPRFGVEEYLLAQGTRFCSRMAPDAFLCLSLSIDLHDVDPFTVDVPTDLISVDSDTLVPPWLMDELEAGLAGPARHHRISSIYGHDAFLKEVEAVGGLLSRILKREDRPS